MDPSPAGPSLRSFDVAETRDNLSTLMALQNLVAARKDLTKLKIAFEAGALTRLVKLMSDDNTPTLRAFASELLSSLAAAKEDSVKRDIVNEDGALACLVKFLTTDNRLFLQSIAAETLANLSFCEDASIHLKIMNKKGALKALVVLLSKSGNGHL